MGSSWMKRFGKFLLVLLVVYILIAGFMYFFQENMIFFPERLDESYSFNFDVPFEEQYIKSTDGAELHGILFKADSSRGLIFYLHGNAGSLRRWGDIADTYTKMNYDVFMLDYRGYGKSEGRINNEKQLYKDNQVVYDFLKSKYPEDNIIILGYSIGTGPAAELAASNKPGLLILQAPYYSLTDMMQRYYPFLPTGILKYKFETYKYLGKIEAPIVIFHGDEDEVIYYGASLKLQDMFKETDTLIRLEGQRHNGMSDNKEYLEAFKFVLNER